MIRMFFPLLFAAVKRAKKLLLVLCLILFSQLSVYSQLDSLAKQLYDTVVRKLIDESIPQKTFKDRFMYPHRWYVKQLLSPRSSDFDTSYILSVKQRLVITVPLAKKFYGFNINDLGTGKEVDFAPNNYYHVGFNFNNIILSFGFYPGIKFGAKPNSGSTKSRDLQLTIIGRRVITDVNFQRYRGFYVLNSGDFSSNTFSGVIVRPDIKTFSFGVNTMFVFNYRKYSLRGSFSYTDVQRKNAGSFMAGLYHSYVLLNALDSAVISPALQPGFSEGLYQVKDISLITVGLSGGYGYTAVYKKLIFSSLLNLGLGAQKTNYATSDNAGHTLSLNPSAHLNAKGSIRYDNLRFFVGAMATYDNNYTLNPEFFNAETYTSKVLLFFGYRFNIKQNGRKVLRAMGLVDYNK